MPTSEPTVSVTPRRNYVAPIFLGLATAAASAIALFLPKREQAPAPAASKAEVLEAAAKAAAPTLSVAEVAERLAVSEQEVRAMVRDGALEERGVGQVTLTSVTAQLTARLRESQAARAAAAEVKAEKPAERAPTRRKETFA